jgi:formylglycine-generating enzyme required for sulfatase activity
MGFSIPQGEFRGRTMPVESFEENPWGLFNVHGNIWEWCEDIWHNTYRGAPTDGSAWLPSVGAEPSRAFWGASDDFVDAEGRLPNRRVVRGGSWNDVPDCLHAAYRDKYRAGRRIDLIGFRLARTLNT